jgi:cytoskeletal protein CcmA (bactofilin family)
MNPFNRNTACRRNVRSQTTGRWLVALLAAGSAGPAQAAETEGNVYMAGAEVRIDRAVHGDLVAAAGRMVVEQPVSGDTVLGAGSLDVQAPIGDDLRAAGGIVAVASEVSGEALIAAARINLRPAARIHGQAWLAGNTVLIDGVSLAGVRVVAREVTILGTIHGPVEIAADRIQVRAAARIHGDVTYRGAQEISIDPLAQISGRVTRSGTAQPQEPRQPKFTFGPVRPLLLAALFAAAVLMHALLPRVVASCVRAVGSAPIRSIGLGSALTFGVPPVAVLLVITIIGIPIGLALAAVYAFALLAGYLIAVFFIAEKFAAPIGRQRWNSRWRLAFVATALVMLTLATSIPYAGPLIALTAISAGVGALVLQAFSRRATQQVT